MIRRADGLPGGAAGEATVNELSSLGDAGACYGARMSGLRPDDLPSAARLASALAGTAGSRRGGRRRHGIWARVAVAALAAASPRAAPAQGLDEPATSPDVTIDLEAPALAVLDEDAAFEQAGGAPMLADLGVLPGAADLAGYHLLANGDQLFSLDTTATLGAVTARPVDVVRVTPAAVYTLEFDGVAAGLPLGTRVDAVSVDASSHLLLSFDTTVELATATRPIVVDDEDLVSFDAGSGVFALVFDGSAAGVPPAADLDAAHFVAGNGHLLLSFDISGAAGGVSFDDEDVLEYDPTPGTFTPRLVLAARDPDWLHADLDAFHLRPGLCGDANADDFVNHEDVERIRLLLADPIGQALTAVGATRCSVRHGLVDCDVADVATLARALPAPGLAPGIQPVCSAAN